jgi:hypothetical protein
MSVLRLCYIDSPWAYFTSQEIDKQWGDDWNDAPYEHNAGEPYLPCWHNHPSYIDTDRAGVKAGELCRCKSCLRDWNDDGTPKWEVMRVAYNSSLLTPAEIYSRVAGVSVEQINSKQFPWLYAKGHEPIYAGTCIDSFIRKIEAAGGEVYTRVDNGVFVGWQSVDTKE